MDSLETPPLIWGGSLRGVKNDFEPWTLTSENPAGLQTLKHPYHAHNEKTDCSRCSIPRESPPIRSAALSQESWL